MTSLDSQPAQGAPPPMAVTAQWTKAVLKSRDLAAAWPLTDPALRQRLVRAWIDANLWHPALKGEDPDTLCASLSIDAPTGHRLWEAFAATQVAEFCKAWDHVNPEHAGFASYPRPVGVDRELVLYVDKGFPGEGVVDAPEGEEVKIALPHVGFIMWLDPDAGWLVEDFTFEDGSDAQDASRAEIKPVSED